MLTLYTVFSFKTRQAVSNFIQPVLSHVGGQVSAFHMLESRASPLECSLYVAALMLIIFRQFDMGIDVALCRGSFPQPERFVYIPTSFLKDGQSLHGQAEIRFR